MTDQWPLRITLPGEPIGKGRPRVRVVAVAGKRPVPTLYSPKATKDYEAALRQVAALAMRGRAVISGPVCIVIRAYMGIPQSWSDRKKDQARWGMVFPTGKPDWENIAKGCCDSLNKIVYNDDAQIVMATVRKIYDDNPRLEIGVSPV